MGADEPIGITLDGEAVMHRIDARLPRPPWPAIRTRVMHVLEHPPASLIWLTLTAATVIALKAIGL